MDNLSPIAPVPLPDKPRRKVLPIAGGILLLVIIVGLIVVFLSGADLANQTTGDDLLETDKKAIVDSLAESSTDTLSEEEKEAVMRSLE